MHDNSTVIVAAQRSAIGLLQGQWQTLTATDLSSAVIAHIMQQTQLPGKIIDELLLGCVLTAGQGQAPARQAAIKAGLPVSVAATTINKMCGSGMKAIMLGSDAINAQQANFILAGGQESMTHAPHLLPKLRHGVKFGNAEIFDHMLLDGLEDAYDDHQLMGAVADNLATTQNISRQAQDEFATLSLQRAQTAAKNGDFKAEITPIKIKDEVIALDEGPSKFNTAKIASLKPAFSTNGTVTAANASAMADGAACCLLTNVATCNQYKLTPIARIVGYTQVADAPNLFPLAPIAAVKKLLTKIEWQLDMVDLIEINEAFAVVVLACCKALKLPLEKVNVHGGACSLGHPIGASGARIVVTLLHALRKYNLRRGIATACIGGGEATAIAIEII